MSWVLFWSSVYILGTDLAETFDIPKMSVRIDCTAQKLLPTLLAMLCRSRFLSNISRVCMTLTFSSVVAFWGAARLSIILKVLAPPLKLCCPSFHCAIRRRLLPKDFHEVFMNILGRYSFLTEELDNGSDFICPSIGSKDWVTKNLIQCISSKHIRLRTFWSHLENNIYLDQLASNYKKPADQERHCFPICL